MRQKTAYMVDVDLKIRVVVNENLDPNMDREFDQAVLDRIKHRIKEEGLPFISNAINDFQDDIDNPYNPEVDEKV